MPGVVRNIDLCSGHGCYPPRLPIIWSPDVFVDGVPVERLTDLLNVHCCPSADCHPGTYMGSNNVYANNLSIQKKGDMIDCGSVCLSCSATVFING